MKNAFLSEAESPFSESFSKVTTVDNAKFRRNAWPEGEYAYWKQLGEPEKMDVGMEGERYQRTVTKRVYKHTTKGDDEVYDPSADDMKAEDWEVVQEEVQG